MAALMGVILCGGESRRMGWDKGLLLKDGAPWVKHMADKLAAYGIPVVFSVNTSQIDAYTAALPGARLVADSAAADGPLKGLLSIHEQFPDKDLLLLACDMLDMDAVTLQRLIDAWREGGYELYSYCEGTFFEPLCGIYTAAGLAGKQVAPSLQNLLRQGKTKSLVMVNNEAFRNYNTL